MEHELLHLLTDPAHWQFELITTVIFDLVTLMVILPLIRAWKSHHRDDHTEIDLLRAEMRARLDRLEEHTAVPRDIGTLTK